MDLPTKIAYISATSDLGGGEISILTTIKSLNRTAFHPVFAVPGPGRLVDRLNGLGVEPAVIPMEVRRRRHPIAFRRSQKAIAKWLKDENPAVVHINSFWAAELAIPPARQVAEGTGMKIIYHTRDFYSYLDRAREAAFRSCDLLLTCSKCVADNVLDLLPGQRVRVMYSCADLEHINSVAPDPSVRDGLGWDDAFVIGVASRLSPEKGQMDFVRAAAEVLWRHANARFLVVGGTQFSLQEGFPAALKAECEKLGISDLVHFTGFVDSMIGLYKSLDTVVLASHREPLGRVVFEGMACGVPVVATRSGGPQEMITDSVDGLLVDPESPQQIADACCRLIESPDLRGSLVANAMRTVESRFSLNQAREVEGVYRELIDGGTGPAK